MTSILAGVKVRPVPKYIMDNLPPRFIVSIGVVVAGVTCGVLTLASYNPLSKTHDHVQAIKVLDDLKHQIERKRYHAAIKHFAPHVQMKIKNIGGGQPHSMVFSWA